MSDGRAFFFSVDQNRHHLSAGDREAEPEKEQQIEHKLPEPDSRGAEVHGAGDGGTYLTPVSVVAGLLKVVPELQREKFYPDEQWEKHPGGKPAVCLQVPIAQGTPVDGHPARAGEDAPDGQCGTEPKQNCPYRAPVNGLLTTQQGKEIFQRDFRCNICFLRVTAVHQVGKGQPQRVGQWFQRVDVRQADPRFP